MERGESIVALAKVEILLHCDQPRKALGLGIVQKGGWEEQRNVNDVIVRGGRNEAKFWLVHLLNLMKLRELTTEGCVRATLPPSTLFADRALLHRGYSISDSNALVETVSKYKGLH